MVVSRLVVRSIAPGLLGVEVFSNEQSRGPEKSRRLMAEQMVRTSEYNTQRLVDVIPFVWC